MIKTIVDDGEIVKYEINGAIIMSVTDKSKIFAKGSGVGYIASQKIIHTMQYLNWYKVAKNI